MPAGRIFDSGNDDDTVGERYATWADRDPIPEFIMDSFRERDGGCSPSFGWVTKGWVREVFPHLYHGVDPVTGFDMDRLRGAKVKVR